MPDKFEVGLSRVITEGKKLDSSDFAAYRLWRQDAAQVLNMAFPKNAGLSNQFHLAGRDPKIRMAPALGPKPATPPQDNSPYIKAQVAVLEKALTAPPATSAPGVQLTVVQNQDATTSSTAAARADANVQIDWHPAFAACDVLPPGPRRTVAKRYLQQLKDALESTDEQSKTKGWHALEGLLNMGSDFLLRVLPTLLQYGDRLRDILTNTTA